MSLDPDCAQPTRSVLGTVGHRLNSLHSETRMSRFAHWFARRATASRGARKPSLPHTRRIGVERLEDRAVPATLSISDATLTEGNSGQKDFVFTVTLSEASG